VGNGLAERSTGGALRVDMNPLVIPGGICKQVDPLLVDQQPVAEAQMLTNR